MQDYDPIEISRQEWENGDHRNNFEKVSDQIKQRKASSEDSWLSKAWKGLTGQASAEATLKANEMNIANQNYWNAITMQREDTAHQREMADLQAAGLNPWLSVSGGGAQSAQLNTATAEPVDGSKMLQATSAAALLAIVKLLSRSTTRTTTNTNYNFKK